MRPTDKPGPSLKSRPTARILVLSGGALRGALQVRVVQHLMATHDYTAIYGVSIGAVNGVLAAMGQLDRMERFWSEFDGLRAYLRPRWLYGLAWVTGLTGLYERVSGQPVMGGFYNTDGLRRRIESNVRLADLETPFVAGVISLNTGRYHELDSRRMTTDQRLADAVLASSCVAPVMTPPLLQLEPDTAELEAGFDGGGRNLFPVPGKEARDLRGAGYRIELHAVGCMPRDRLRRVNTCQVSGPVEVALRAVEVLAAEVFDTDLLQLQQAAGPGGEVHLWLPEDPAGGSFDATPSVLRGRIDEGARMVAQGPEVLPGT